MKKTRLLKIIIVGALLWPVLMAWPLISLFAKPGVAVPDQRLVGQWRGQNRFHGMSYNEIVKKKVVTQNVETVINIAADGKVTGHIGGAELHECVVTANRGWIGRHLHIMTDFIIRGDVSGAVVPGSDSGTHVINAPFNLKGPGLSGTVFVIHPVTYPYPILGLHVDPDKPR